jgi:hypothetical protein
MPSSENPYSPPKDEASMQPVPTMSQLVAPRAILFVLASSAACGAAGLLIGAALGTLVPGYYRSVFSNGESPNFDPVAVGIGQGLTQGIGTGLAVGIALLVVHYWRRTRENANR